MVGVLDVPFHIPRDWRFSHDEILAKCLDARATTSSHCNIATTKYPTCATTRVYNNVVSITSMLSVLACSIGSVDFPAVSIDSDSTS